MDKIQQSYLCPRCGQLVNPNDNLCGGCNAQLTWPVNDFEYASGLPQKKKPSIAIIGISILVALIIFGSTISALTGSRITKADAPIILNMAENLPQRFKQVDADQVGMSTKNMDLGPGASEIQLFVSEEPMQVIYGFILISSNLIARCNDDAFMKDDQQFKNLILKNMREKASEQNVELSFPEIVISHPSLGDVCVFGTGNININGVNYKFDTLSLRKYQVYVMINSYYMEDEGSVSLIPLANEMIRRMDKLK
jgi:hypothetical protein